MDTLHRSFQALLLETTKTIIARRLADAGISMPDNYMAMLADVVVLGSFDDGLEVDLSDGRRVDLFETIGARDIRERLINILPQLADSAANPILDSLKASADQMIRDRSADRTRFEERLYQDWGQQLRLFEMILVIAEEIGADYNHLIRTTYDMAVAHRFDALSRLHARACQVSLEVLTLLKSGLADGAHARWRTLHEISVTATLISQNDDNLAERYLLHTVVEMEKSSRVYQDHCGELGFEPLSDAELNHLVRSKDELLDRFGRDFRNDYGWAAELIDGNPNPRFVHLEQAAGLSHMRPFYMLANINVHAGARGIHFRMGLPEYDQNSVLLSSYSNIGLIDPCQNTIYSLIQTTMAFLKEPPSFDFLVSLNILMKLQREFLDSLQEPGVSC